MKRSEINAAIKEMEAMIKEHGFEIPPFCNWTPDWGRRNHVMMRSVTTCSDGILQTTV